MPSVQQDQVQDAKTWKTTLNVWKNWRRLQTPLRALKIRIMVRPDVISDDQMSIIARDIVNKIEAEMEYPGQIKVNIIRENRAVDYAK